MDNRFRVISRLDALSANELAASLVDAGYRKRNEVIRECAECLKAQVYYDEQQQLVDAFCEHFMEDSDD